jgi:CUB domain
VDCPLVLSQVVELDFNSFDTESCCDFVSILDGYDLKSMLMERLSGNYFTPPGGISSSQRYMFIQFTTDDTVVRSGFSATYISGKPESEESVIYSHHNYISALVLWSKLITVIIAI